MIKNLIIGVLIIGLLSIIGYGFFIQNFDIFADPVETKIKSECDYEGLRKIEMIEISGNAATNRSIQISATDCNSNNIYSEQIFVASASFIEPSDVIFNWKNFDTLTITYNEELKVFKKKNESDSIKPKIIFEYKFDNGTTTYTNH